MLEKYLEEYINDLYRNQNIGACKEQQGLYKKKDYYALLKPVVELVVRYKDYDISELRNILFENSKIGENVKNFVYGKQITPGIVFSYGTNHYKETIVAGNKSEVTVDSSGNITPNKTKMTEDTIFDLASTTKIFTSISILKLVQKGIIHLNDEITKYEPRFKNLKGITIFDLISFKVPLRTDGRVNGQANRNIAEDVLFTLSKDETFQHGNHPYTDMGALALKYVIENASGMNYYEFLYENILKPLQMTDTYTVVPQVKLDKVASTNLETKVMADGNIINLPYIKEGIVNDPKARDLGQPEGILSGHAGLFSTNKDMTNLAKGMINGSILEKNYIEMLAKNRTGEKFIKDGKEQYIQYLGFLCYSKNPILENSEVFHAMSGKSFTSSGYTGTQLTVDPINQLYAFIGANRVHNRVSFVAPAQRQNVKYNEAGKGSILLPNGQEKTTSYTFAWDRGLIIRNPALKLSIQYKMLEDIYALYNEKVEKYEYIRKL